MKIADGELRQLLLKSLKLSPAAVREVVADSRQADEPLLQTVLKSDLASEAAIAKAYAKKLGIPFVDLESQAPSATSLAAVPEELAKQFGVVAIDVTKTSIKLAMSDPTNDQAKQAVRQATGKAVRRYAATRTGLRQALRGYEQTRWQAPRLSGRELAMTILEQAASQGASHLHLAPTANGFSMRLRVHGRLTPARQLPAERAAAVIAWLKLQAGLDVDAHHQAQTGRLQTTLHQLPYSLVLQSLPLVDGENLTLQLLASAPHRLSLEHLGMRRGDAAHLRQLVRDGRGLVLIAGPAYSPATSVARSLTLEAAHHSDNLTTTIEDQVLFDLPGCQQVATSSNLSATAALRAAIAGAPQSILYDAPLTREALESLVDYSLAKHLIIVHVASHSLTQSLHQLTKRELTPALVAASLRALVQCHSVDLLCPHCRLAYEPQGQERRELTRNFAIPKAKHVWRQGPGCARCDGGLTGKQTLYEYVPVTPALQQLLATKADDASLHHYLAEEGGFTSQLAALVVHGRVAAAAALALTKLA